MPKHTLQKRSMNRQKRIKAIVKMGRKDLARTKKKSKK